MTSKQRRGRYYVAAVIAVVVLFDLCIKFLQFAGGTLRWSQAVGTVLTILTCWFLWRGSKFAHGFLTVCIIATIALVQFGFSTVPSLIVAAAFIVLGLVLLALVAPATRKFTTYQRETYAQSIIPADA